ncbi:signal recognition particle subunit SRP72, putative (SRP72) [Plasmodium ovale wallikeri]|uniref:Signal recognition particle subunit SRP72, putative (SRP72) n=1 Tax=Plasmodium ovale wallikeri TaxID=864142 RepID=A0A1A8YXB6_PLAOA|nr:signal recognition particle subunit SRP72, putative (SRP72) [Plasmodium ovale wallikeri]
MKILFNFEEQNTWEKVSVHELSNKATKGRHNPPIPHYPPTLSLSLAYTKKKKKHTHTNVHTRTSEFIHVYRINSLGKRKEGKMEEESQRSFRETASMDEIKLSFENKHFDDVIKLTKDVYNDNDCNEYALRARYSCFIQKEEFNRVVFEVVNSLIKIKKEKERKKKTIFQNIFQQNYEKIKNKNILFEFFYSMYKLKKYKKLNGSLKYILEKEEKYDDYIDILMAQVNFKLRNFETSIIMLEGLLTSDKQKHIVEKQMEAATINLHASYISMYMKLLFEYKFLKKKKIINNETQQQNVHYTDIEDVREQLLTSTNNFNYDENDCYEKLFNYATFFALEKRFPEAVQILDFLDDMCKNTLVGEGVPTTFTNGEVGSSNGGTTRLSGKRGSVSAQSNVHTDIGKRSSHVEASSELNNKWMFSQLQRAYVYIKMNRVKDAITIYENILNGYENCLNAVVVLVAYNNYVALMHNEKEKIGEDKNTSDSSISFHLFHINSEKLLQIRTFLLMHKGIHNDLNDFMLSMALYNDCMSSLTNMKKEEFTSKLAHISGKYRHSILRDKLIIISLKKENYLKCKQYLFNNINLVNCTENKINYINAYACLCYEKKSFNEVVRIYLKYEDVFRQNVDHYSVFFSNLFYIYICVNNVGKCRDVAKIQNTLSFTDGNIIKENLHHNVDTVVSLFEKYKQAAKENVQVVNYETLFLVSKFLIYHNKTDVLIDMFTFLSKEEKNNFHLFSCFTYIYTYIDISNVHRYEDKLKKTVLAETYLIDVEELENKNVTFDFSSKMQGKTSLSVQQNRKKRKRSKKKETGVQTKVIAAQDLDKWLPKHEKGPLKRPKQKKQRGDVPDPEVLAEKTEKEVAVEDTKIQTNQCNHTAHPSQVNQAKLHNLKKRRKKK